MQPMTMSLTSLYLIYLVSPLEKRNTNEYKCLSLFQSIAIITKHEIGSGNVLAAAALVLRETLVRPSLSPSLPRITCTHANSCTNLSFFFFYSFIHILCPDKVALRGNVTDFSGDAEFWPSALLAGRPEENNFQ